MGNLLGTLTVIYISKSQAITIYWFPFLINVLQIASIYEPIDPNRKQATFVKC